MATFSRERLIAAPVSRVWPLVVDWQRHGAVVPFTDTRVEDENLFVARSGIGPRRLIGFDDSMEVTDRRPPAGTAGGRVVVRKTGRVLRGSAVIEVRPAGPDRTLVVWTYRDLRLAVPVLGQVLDGLTERISAVVVTRVLADVARAAARAGDTGGPDEQP